MMAGEKERYKKALERYAKHLQEIRNITSVIPKGTDAERTSRMVRAREDYDFFVQAYFPHLATSRCGKFQIEAAEYIKNNPRARCVFEWARGHAKSSHISLMIPLWLKIQENPEPMIMVLVSKSADMARRLLSDLQAELEGNDLFLHDFGRQKTDGLWTDGEFVCADGSMFIALGRGQSPRGIKRRGLRVNYISIDDIDDDEMCRNPRRVDEAVDWCLSALIGTMAMGRGRFVLVGNRIGQYSILGEMASRPHFYHTVVNALDKKGKPSWWQNYQLSEINDLRVEVGERRFQKEYMNNPLDEGSVFERKYIRYGKQFFEGANRRYTEYAKSLEPKLGIPYTTITPLIFSLIQTCVHYAMFEDEYYLQSQLEALKQAIRLLMTQYRTEDARPDVKAES